MSSDKGLTAAELAAWDAYVAATSHAVLAGWFRWKLGRAVDAAEVVSQACALADAFIIERRKR